MLTCADVGQSLSGTAGIISCFRGSEVNRQGLTLSAQLTYRCTVPSLHERLTVEVTLLTESQQVQSDPFNPGPLPH